MRGLRRELSVVIPTYNHNCYKLVHCLLANVETLRGEIERGDFRFEIVVADDGSTDPTVVESNRRTGSLPHSRYIERGFNSGRAAIRNFLAREARYEWLLFLDADVDVDSRNDFLNLYVSAEEADVVYGGLEVWIYNKNRKLRCAYESEAWRKRTLEQRRLEPYESFSTANFMVRREVMLSHPFDERIERYGYEDVLFGRELERSGISINHINAPVYLLTFDDNAEFVRKTEESLETLHDFRDDLRGYSHLLATAEKPKLKPLLWALAKGHRLWGEAVREALIKGRPRLWLFSLYKLGYYLNIK